MFQRVTEIPQTGQDKFNQCMLQDNMTQMGWFPVPLLSKSELKLEADGQQQQMTTPGATPVS